MRYLVLLVAAVAISAGCGGGADDSAQSTNGATAPATAPAPTPREQAQKSLRRYMAQSRIANGFYQRARSIVVRAYTENAEAQWGSPEVEAAGEEYARAAALLSEGAVRQRLATPPPSLRGINRRFAADMGAVSDLRDEQGAALRSGNQDAWNRINNSSAADVGGPVRNQWRISVTVESRRLGLELPEWAETIGTNPVRPNQD